MSKPPNFLFIITDQHRADHLGCYGNAVVKTPNIDSLAVSGKLWERFYVANPICMPNRASIMTGRMCSVHGARHNGIPLSKDQTTFVELLKDAGYKTGLIGKSQPLANRLNGDFYGFEHVEIAANHADQASGDYLLWAREQRADFDQLVGPENAMPHNRASAPQAWRTAVPEERDNQSPFAVTADEARTITALTYGMITMIDDAIGRVIAKLDALNLRENTVVIFTSDHGDYMGDHGLMLKLLLHYQGLVKVPFIWNEHGSTHGHDVSKALSSSIDIAATILARAGIQPYNGLQGRDLFSDQAPDSVIIEEDSQRLMTGFERLQRVRTIVTERYRMSLRAGEDWNELYDLHNDPHELKNLYDDPDHLSVRNEVTETMVRRMIDLQDRSPLPAYRA